MQKKHNTEPIPIGIIINIMFNFFMLLQHYHYTSKSQNPVFLIVL